MFPFAVNATAAARIAEMLGNGGGSCSRGCTTPEKLHWWGHKIHDSDCVALAANLQRKSRPVLKNLLLGSNAVGDECMSALSAAAHSGALTSLRALGLSRNYIGDDGCVALAGAIGAGKLPLLVDLFISKNAVGDRCAIALAGALKAPSGAPPVTRLGLDINRVGVAGLRALLSVPMPTGKRQISLVNNSGICADEAAANAAADAKRSPLSPLTLKLKCATGSAKPNGRRRRGRRGRALGQGARRRRMGS